MSKEAQEEILKLIRAKPNLYTSLYVHGSYSTPSEILSLVEELGYRKLPKDKPLLVEVQDCHQVDHPFDYNMGAQAQWDIWNDAIYGS